MPKPCSWLNMTGQVTASSAQASLGSPCSSNLYNPAGTPHRRHLSHELQAGGEAIRKAVTVAVQSKDPALIQQLSALLEGEPGGAGPDTGNLLLLKMALGHFDEAAELAVGLARQDQEAGNYKVCLQSAP